MATNAVVQHYKHYCFLLLQCYKYIVHVCINTWCTVDAEIFMREIHVFSWAKFSRDSIFVDGYPHEILNPMKFFVCEKFQCKPKQSRSTRRLSRIKARTFWEAAVGKTVVCMVVSTSNFHDRNAVAVLRKMEESLRTILPRNVSPVHAFFWR